MKSKLNLLLFFRRTKNIEVLSILFSLLLIYSFVTAPRASAEVTDYVSFPYNQTTFDSMTSYGVLTFTDSLAIASWNRVRQGPAPFIGELRLYFIHGVNLKKYTFQTELVSPSGKATLLNGRESSSESKYSVNCWQNSCKTTYLVYPVTLPENSETGKYSLRFTAKWLGSNCVGTVCESGVTKSQTATAVGALEITGATPTPTPVAPLTRLVQDIKAPIVENQFLANKSFIFNPFSTSYLPLTIYSGTPNVCEYLVDSIKLKSIGWCSIELMQLGNDIYLPAYPKTIQFRILSDKTTITCVKGKLTKKVTAVKPKCPRGYKVKK
jgi:hypothetical protein